MKLFLVMIFIMTTVFASNEVTIGVLAFRSKAETSKEWSETIAYLNQVRPEYRFRAIPLNYQEMNSAALEKKVDFIVTNSGHYIELEHKYHISRIATMIRYQNGRWIDRFGGVVFTLAQRKDIQSLEDLKDKTIASVDAESLGGYAAQMYELYRLDIEKDDLDIHFLGMPHAQTVQAVLNQQTDAGFVRTDVLEHLAEQGKLDLSKIKILHPQKAGDFPYHLSSALYPEWPIAKMPHTDYKLGNDVVVALLNRLSHGSPKEGSISWTAPLEYHDIHEVFRTLRLPPYDTAPEFDWFDIYLKYKIFFWIIASLTFMIGIGIIIELILRYKLKIESKKTQTFLQMSADGIHILDMNGNVILASDKFCQMLGYSQLEILGMNVTRWDSILSFSLIQAEIENLKPNETKTIYTRHRRKDRSEYDVEINLNMINIEKAVWIYCSARDITQELAQKLHDQKAALVFETSSDAIVITDSNGNFLSANPAFEKMSGYTQDEWSEKNSTILKSGIHDSMYYRQMWLSIITTGQWEGEIVDKDKWGELFQKWLAIRALKDDFGKINQYIAIFSDITNQKEAKHKIWYQANFDSLTGLSNRSMLMFRLEKSLQDSLRDKKTMALLFIDLDHFKEINDTFGHDKGDVLLCDAANRIVHSIRKNDIAARLGGDEFVVVLASVNGPEDVQSIAEALLVELSFPFMIDGIENYVSASIGIVLAPDDGTTADELLKHADQAMYEAKKFGRNRYQFFTSAIQESLDKRSSMLRHLREAISNHDFELHYQPIMNLQSSEICKAEALIRWKSDGGKLISPAEFIPLAEESGLIMEIGNWIFSEAVSQVAKWRKIKPDFQLSVNKSPVQFKNDKSLRSVLIQHMEAAHLPNDAIVVEITEGILMDNNSMIQQRLEEFEKYGIQVSLDDFGTGYSSLAYLKKFDIDYLKIDREFIKNIESNNHDKILCEAIIAMAHKLGIKVIAEGIETQTQKEYLQSYGCDYIQGYLISTPLPASEFENLYIRHF